MRLALLAEIDGNAEALSGALRQLEHWDVDMVCALGGLTGRGPESSRVLDLLEESSVTAIRGGFDEWVLNGKAVEPSAKEAVAATRLELGHDGRARLAALPTARTLYVSGSVIELRHESELPGMLPAAKPPLTPKVLNLVGTQRAGWFRRGDKLYLGTGALSSQDVVEPEGTVLIIDLSASGPTGRLEHLELSFSLPKNAARMRERLKAGSIAETAATRYLKALFGRRSELPSLQPGDRGERFLTHLLIPRARDVYRPLLADWPEDDVELVHDTRVSTRRYQEALNLVRPLIPRSVREGTAARARALRQALGPKRAADVLSDELFRWLDEEQLPPDARSEVLEMFSVRSERSMERFFKELSRPVLVSDGLRAVAAAAFNKHPEVTAAQALASHLRRRLEGVQQRFSALMIPTLFDEHHQLRVAMKRLRYTLEIAYEVYPEPELKELIGTFKNAQEALGHLNDVHDMVNFMTQPRVIHRIGPENEIRALAALREERERTYAQARDQMAREIPPILEQVERLASRTV